MKRAMTFHPKLFCGESISIRKLDKLKRKLQEKPLLVDVYLVVLPVNPGEQLEIFHTKELINRYYLSHPPCVVGIAGTKQEAFLLVERMVKDCLLERGDCALKEFFVC